MWNLLKRFVLTIMCLKTATKLFQNNIQGIERQTRAAYCSSLYFPERQQETLSDLKQQECQWIHQKLLSQLFLSPVKWIMQAKKTDLSDNTEFLFKLTDGHCVFRLLVWSATVKTNYKRAASQRFSSKHVTELCTINYFHVFSVFFYMLHWDVPFSGPKCLASIFSICWSGQY